MKHLFTVYDDLSYLVKKDHLPYDKRRINLGDYLRSRIAFFKEVAAQVNVSVNLQTQVHNIEIYFNETKLQRIIDNNLSNAIKYTLKNEVITIDLFKDSTTTTLIFSSKSTHIQKPEKVFHAYYREDASKDGFGLGLNLVQQICEEEGVTIDLHSNAEHTEFHYTFNTEVGK